MASPEGRAKQPAPRGGRRGKARNLLDAQETGKPPLARSSNRASGAGVGSVAPATEPSSRSGGTGSVHRAVQLADDVVDVGVDRRFQRRGVVVRQAVALGLELLEAALGRRRPAVELVLALAETCGVDRDALAVGLGVAAELA